MQARLVVLVSFAITGEGRMPHSLSEHETVLADGLGCNGGLRR
jgi:hypothetical protein